jgi:hypothetical protein
VVHRHPGSHPGRNRRPRRALNRESAAVVGSESPSQRSSKSRSRRPKTAAATRSERRTIRRETPEVIHNLWIRLKKRSKAIERTCLAEGDRPYSPSLDGASHGAVDGRPQGIPVQLGQAPRRKLRTRNEKVGDSLFNRNTERKENRKVPKKNSGQHRAPELDTASRRKGAPLPSVLEN